MIDFETDKDTKPSTLITDVPDRLEASNVLDKNSNEKGRMEIGNTTVPTIPQVIDAWKVLPPELLELNNRHSGELKSDRLMVRYT